MNNKLTCPTCGAEKVVAYEMHAVDANTFEHYCHSVKAHDPDAKARCLECDWEGERRELNGYVKESST